MVPDTLLLLPYPSLCSILQEQMKTFGIILLCGSLVSCSSLIVREDDTTTQSLTKVTTRIFLAPFTLFLSERYISQLKLTEHQTKQKAEQAVRFGEMCVIGGYTPGTPEHLRCLSGKQDQVERISSGWRDNYEEKHKRICEHLLRPKWCP